MFSNQKGSNLRKSYVTYNMVLKNFWGSGPWTCRCCVNFWSCAKSFVMVLQKLIAVIFPYASYILNPMVALNKLRKIRNTVGRIKETILFFGESTLRWRKIPNITIIFCIRNCNKTNLKNQTFKFSLSPRRTWKACTCQGCRCLGLLVDKSLHCDDLRVIRG